MLKIKEKHRKTAIILLLLPLAISVLTLVYLKLSPYYSSAPEGEMLAPVESGPLFIGLIIFSIGYVIFLLIIFSENVKGFLNIKD